MRARPCRSLGVASTRLIRETWFWLFVGALDWRLWCCCCWGDGGLVDSMERPFDLGYPGRGRDRAYGISGAGRWR